MSYFIIGARQYMAMKQVHLVQWALKPWLNHYYWTIITIVFILVTVPESVIIMFDSWTFV